MLIFCMSSTKNRHRWKYKSYNYCIGTELCAGDSSDESIVKIAEILSLKLN